MKVLGSHGIMSFFLEPRKIQHFLPVQSKSPGADPMAQKTYARYFRMLRFLSWVKLHFSETLNHTLGTRGFKYDPPARCDPKRVLFFGHF